MTEGSKANDRAIDAIVHNAIESVNRTTPSFTMRLWQRIALFVAGVLIIGNTIGTGFVVEGLNNQANCERAQATQVRAITDADRAAVDHIILGIANAKHLTHQQFEQLLQNYKNERAKNDAQRAELESHSCT